MPQLETFAFCEKVIIDRKTDTASLIGLVNVLTVRTEKIPQDAVAPLSWWIFVTHSIDPNDPADIEYEQKIELITPDGTVSLEMKTDPFRMSGTGFRQTYHSENFPVGQAGVHQIRLSMRLAGTPEWRVESTLKILVRHPNKATPA